MFLNPRGQSALTTGGSALASRIEAENAAIAKAASEQERTIRAKQTAATYQAQAASDPFALYALCKTIIYGKEHNEAFELLERAARLAIEQGKAADLSRRIADDVEADRRMELRDRTIWRLSVGHEHHWLPIIAALTTNNPKLLHAD